MADTYIFYGGLALVVGVIAALVAAFFALSQVETSLFDDFDHRWTDHE